MTANDIGEQGSWPVLGPPLVDGPWAGWSRLLTTEPFEDLAGPFYARREPDGSVTSGFRPGAPDLNSLGIVHGGALATFADYALGLIAIDPLQGLNAVTVTLNTDFVGSARVGDLLEARGEVLRAGRSMLFVRGVIRRGDEPVLGFSGALKVLRSRG